MLPIMSWRQARQCGGRAMAMSLMLMTQPRIVLVVSQVASPLRSFLTDTGFLWCGVSMLSHGQKTWSMDWRSCCRSVHCVVGLPWARLIKSSTNTLT